MADDNLRKSNPIFVDPQPQGERTDEVMSLS